MIPRLCASALNRIRRHFTALYGKNRADACVERLAAVIGRYGVGMLAGNTSNGFSAADIALIAYPDAVRAPDAPPLAVLRRFFNRRLRGAFNTLHLLPFFPWSSDDGFAVVDYRAVDPAYGDWSDIEKFGGDTRLVFDLVLNHVSRRSAWFQDYLNGIAPARHYFIETDPSEDLSRVVRPRSGPLLARVRAKSDEHHVWTTFGEDQIDLNFANPDVLFEFIDIMLFYISKGARVLRLDAVAYLWKAAGTDCIHAPQTHAIVKLLRALLDMVAPEVRLLTETNVPHAENIAYFGRGDEAHLVYQFPLPPLLLHAVHKQDASALTRWAANLTAPPPGCAFLNFTASHDGIGVRPLEGLVDAADIADLAECIPRRGGRVSFKRNADGTESPYELNIAYPDAVSAGDGSGRDGDLRRFMTVQAAMLALKGIPAVYFPSLCGARNDSDGAEKSGIARRINRQKFEEAELDAMLDASGGEPRAVFESQLRMLRIRAVQPAFAPDASQSVLDLHPACFALRRESADPAQTLVCIGNFSGNTLRLGKTGSRAILASAERWSDLLSDISFETSDGLPSMQPWQTLWLAAESKS